MHPRSRSSSIAEATGPPDPDEQWNILLQHKTQSTQAKVPHKCRTAALEVTPLTMMLDNFGHQHWSMGDRTPIVESPVENVHGYPRKFHFQSTPATNRVPEAIHVSTAPSALISKFWMKLRSWPKKQFQKIRQSKPVSFVGREGGACDIERVAWTEKTHPPLNHKLEQMHMHIYIGSEQGDGLVCRPTPAET